MALAKGQPRTLPNHLLTFSETLPTTQSTKRSALMRMKASGNILFRDTKILFRPTPPTTVLEMQQPTNVQANKE